jgi:MFS-type transporter involved in bile tolerance (Atg22 family)
MYIGAVLCALISVATIYQITVTQNTSDEWIIWICVLLGFGLAGFGYLYESKHKKDRSENEPTPPSAMQ